MKLDILMHYEVEESTGEIKFIGKEEIVVDTAKKTTKTSSKKTSVVDDNPNPVIKLEENKLVLNQKAVDLLEVCPDCRIDIKYKKRDKQSVPVIGTDAAFETKAGNKLTKSNTVSFRGAANTKLAAYGDTFTLEPTEEHGIFYLVGNVVPQEPEVPEEIIDIEKELDMAEIDKIDESDLADFTLTL